MTNIFDDKNEVQPQSINWGKVGDHIFGTCEISDCQELAEEKLYFDAGEPKELCSQCAEIFRKHEQDY